MASSNHPQFQTSLRAGASRAASKKRDFDQYSTASGTVQSHPALGQIQNGLHDEDDDDVDDVDDAEDDDDEDFGSTETGASRARFPLKRPEIQIHSLTSPKTPTASTTTTTTTGSAARTAKPIQQSKVPLHNASGKLMYANPIPPPVRLLAPIPDISLPEPTDPSDPPPSLEYITIPGNSGASDSVRREYPSLTTADSSLRTSAESLLLLPNGLLRPASERVAIMNALERRVEKLKHQCTEIVRSAKALQRLCQASAVPAPQSFTNANEETQPTGVFPTTTNGTGQGSTVSIQLKKKPAINGNGGANGPDIVSVDTKDKLRDELLRIVNESKALRQVIESTPVATDLIGEKSEAPGNEVSVSMETQ